MDFLSLLVGPKLLKRSSTLEVLQLLNSHEPGLICDQLINIILLEEFLDQSDSANNGLKSESLGQSQ